MLHLLLFCPHCTKLAHETGQAVLLEEGIIVPLLGSTNLASCALRASKMLCAASHRSPAVQLSPSPQALGT